MLERLSGRAHEVLTAVALAAAEQLTFRLSASAVRFRALSRRRSAAPTGTPASRTTRRAPMPSRGAARPSSNTSAAATRASMGLPLFETAELLRAARIPTLLDGAPRGAGA